MSDTPKLADECKKLLDNGWMIVLYKNQLHTYSAEAARDGMYQRIFDALSESNAAIGDCDPKEEHAKMMEHGRAITDDFEPSQALYRLTEKVFGRIV